MAITSVRSVATSKLAMCVESTIFNSHTFVELNMKALVSSESSPSDGKINSRRMNSLWLETNVCHISEMVLEPGELLPWISRSERPRKTHFPCVWESRPELSSQLSMKSTHAWKKSPRQNQRSTELCMTFQGQFQSIPTAEYGSYPNLLSILSHLMTLSALSSQNQNQSSPSLESQNTLNHEICWIEVRRIMGWDVASHRVSDIGDVFHEGSEESFSRRKV